MGINDLKEWILAQPGSGTLFFVNPLNNDKHHEALNKQVSIELLDGDNFGFKLKGHGQGKSFFAVTRLYIMLSHKISKIDSSAKWKRSFNKHDRLVAATYTSTNIKDIEMLLGALILYDKKR